jgi:hypothetical protein
LVIATRKPNEAGKATPLNVTVAMAWSAPVVVAVAGDNDTTARPFTSESAVAGLNLPNPPGDVNATTWPATATPLASFTAAVTVAGVVVVTVVVDNRSEIEGVPTVPLTGTTAKPEEAVNATALTVTVAITVSAPSAVGVEGASRTTAFPAKSVKAVLGLKVPNEPTDAKLTTCPTIGAPAASATNAVTVTGEAAVTVIDEREMVTVGVRVVPPPVPPPMLGIGSPPPHAASAALNPNATSTLIQFIETSPDSF